MRRLVIEARRLIKVRVLWDGGSGWTFNFPKGMKVFHGSVEDLARFLKKLQATDVATTPKTAQNKRYIDMAREIQTGKDTKIWIWSNILSKLKGTVFGKIDKRKEQQEKRMKKLTLTQEFKIPGTDLIAEVGDQIVIKEANTATAKCPDCDSKYLVATGYCVKCKKKVKKEGAEWVAKDPDTGKVIKEFPNKAAAEKWSKAQIDSGKAKETDLAKKEADTSTAKCPDCGSKYLKATGYCVKCKKKVKTDKKEASFPSVRYMYTMANRDFMKTAKKVMVDREGWVTNMNGQSIDPTPIEDYGDYYLSDKPVTNAFDRWNRQVESIQRNEAIKPEEFERLYYIFVGTLESEGVLVDEQRSEMSKNKATIALDSPEELDLVYDEVIIQFQKNERNAKKLKIKWDQKNLAQYINVSG